ncbi:MAG: DegQ family serine endoprotease [Rhodospirillaceae bacterium]|jgi:serine protease Do
MNTHDTHKAPKAKRPWSKTMIAGTVTASLIGSAAFGAFALARANDNAGVTTAAPSALLVSGQLAPNTFSAIAAKVSPAVVNIQVEQTASTDDGDHSAGPGQNPFQGMPENSPFQEFFEKFFGENMPHFGNPNGMPQQGQKVMGMGSGFIIDKEGYIVTNDHVVGNADKITVTLTSGEKHDAKLIGRDSKTDLALLKIDTDQKLPFVSWGNSKAAKVGDWVVAVGNPFGLGGTVTSGIISALGRDINAGPFDDFLQIDASINRGNSGGPTFNLQGEVIGINTAIYSPNGGSVGIGFAVPSSMAKPIIAQLKEKGSVSRGWLGVHIQRVTPEIAESLGLDQHQGALISKIEPKSPAAKSGLKQGDVILSVDGEAIEKMRELPKVVAAIQAGKKADFGVWRGGKKKSVTVVIGSLPKTMTVAAKTPQKKLNQNAFGMTLATLTPQLRSQYKISKHVAGVLVVRVKPNSAAAKMGLTKGDVIRRVGPQDVNQPTDVKFGIEKAQDQKRKAVLILVNRRGNELFFALKLRKA